MFYFHHAIPVINDTRYNACTSTAQNSASCGYVPMVSLQYNLRVICNIGQIQKINIFVEEICGYRIHENEASG